MTDTREECEHDSIELVGDLEDLVELWGCNDCDYEECRVIIAYGADYNVIAQYPEGYRLGKPVIYPKF